MRSIAREKKRSHRVAVVGSYGKLDGRAAASAGSEAYFNDVKFKSIDLHDRAVSDAVSPGMTEPRSRSVSGAERCCINGRHASSIRLKHSRISTSDVLRPMYRLNTQNSAS